MKAMISQPMKGKNEQEILATRERAIEKLKALGYEVVNSFFVGDWCKPESMTSRGVVNIPLCFLARSLDTMSMCDAVYFCKDWQFARGCRVEHEAAQAYGLTPLYEHEPFQEPSENRF